MTSFFYGRHGLGPDVSSSQAAQWAADVTGEPEVAKEFSGEVIYDDDTVTIVRLHRTLARGLSRQR